MGRIGYVPRWRTWTGVRAVDKTAEEAVALYHAANALESAGAWAVEMELVPVEIADFITRNTSLVTEGMGCGAVCDTRYLFSCDILATNTGHYRRPAKRYGDLATEDGRLQRLRIEALQAFADDVASGAYPRRQHDIHVSEDILKALLEASAGRHDSAKDA
jgi:3-methyl-2-oxobutanoate hydroxymethyltransferase